MTRLQVRGLVQGVQAQHHHEGAAVNRKSLAKNRLKRLESLENSSKTTKNEAKKA